MQEEQQPNKATVKRKKRFRARFFSIFLTIFICVVIGYFFWQTTHSQIPNLHGWSSTEVLDFSRENYINLEIEFIYSNEVAPTLVISQSIPPRTAITEGMDLTIEVSKGIEVQ